jgi:hypothetical protein
MGKSKGKGGGSSGSSSSSSSSGSGTSSGMIGMSGMSGMSSMASAETQTSGGMGKTMAEGRTPKISSGMSKTMAKDKTPNPDTPATCSEMKDQDMCEKDTNADNHCKWDDDDGCYKGCPGDGLALEGSMRSLGGECSCVNYYFKKGFGCDKCPVGSIAISESVCSEVLTDATIGNAYYGASDTAIGDWFIDSVAATAKWGHISDW